MTERRLSLVLALLATLAANINGKALNVSAHDPYNGYATNSNVQYEVIDMANSNNTNGDILHAGETTRFYTTGEVDDNFWLKHLGEDFKRAIHLQVDDNNNPYADDGGDVGAGDGVSNLTHNANQVNVEHDYTAFGLANRNPVQQESDHSFSSQQQQKQQSNTNYPTESNAESQAQAQTTTEYPMSTTASGNIDEAQNNNSSETISFKIVKINKSNNATTPQEDNADAQRHQNDKENDDRDTEKKANKRNSEEGSQEESAAPSSYERVIAMDANGYVTRSFRKKSNRKFKKITNLHKNTPSERDTYASFPNASKEKRKKSQRSHNRYSYTPPPIVITLPDTRNTVHQLDDSDTPVVVKMPPVIYHQNAMRGERQDDHDESHTQQQQEQEQEQNEQQSQEYNDNTNTHSHSHSHLHTHTQHKAYSTHYTSPEQKPHYHQQSDAEDKRQFSAYVRNHFNAAPYAHDTPASFRFVIPKSDNGDSFRKVEPDLSSFDPSASYGGDDGYSRNGRSNQQDIFDKGL